jgi:hypothetical protein
MPRLLWPSWRWMTIQRHAFASHLDGVGVPELVRREASADTCRDSRPAQIGSGGRAGPGLDRSRRRVLAPQHERQPLRAHGPIGVQHQHRQQAWRHRPPPHDRRRAPQADRGSQTPSLATADPTPPEAPAEHPPAPPDRSNARSHRALLLLWQWSSGAGTSMETSSHGRRAAHFPEQAQGAAHEAGAACRQRSAGCIEHKGLAEDP